MGSVQVHVQEDKKPNALTVTQLYAETSKDGILRLGNLVMLWSQSDLSH